MITNVMPSLQQRNNQLNCTARENFKMQNKAIPFGMQKWQLMEDSFDIITEPLSKKTMDLLQQTIELSKQVLRLETGVNETIGNISQKIFYNKQIRTKKIKMCFAPQLHIPGGKVFSKIQRFGGNGVRKEEYTIIPNLNGIFFSKKIAEQKKINSLDVFVQGELKSIIAEYYKRLGIVSQKGVCV